MVAVLAGASVATASATGFVVGLAWSLLGWGRLSPPLGVVVVAAAVIADVVVAPPSVRRQVPQAWGRLFSPSGAALLYGARLGPGPLTILNTWLWWAAVGIAATTDPWSAAFVSGVFGAARVAIMVIAGPAAVRWRRRERLSSVAIAALALAGGVVVAGAASPAAAPPPSPTAVGVPSSPAPAVRPTPSASVPLVPDATSAELAARLPDSAGPGFERLPDDTAKGLGPLDLTAAAQAEEDSSAERSVLETRSFEAGHARAWANADDVTSYVAVYRFATPADALAYQRDGAITLEGRGVRQYPLEVPASAFGFSDVADAPDGGRVTHGVAFVRGRHFVLVLRTSRSDAPAGQDAVRELAAATAALNAP